MLDISALLFYCMVPIFFRYSGENCQSYDYCINNQCRESRQCVTGPSGYTCSCDIAYTGLYCKTRINYCTGSSCQNGGSCVNGLQNATCNCIETFVGSQCELDYREFYQYCLIVTGRNRRGWICHVLKTRGMGDILVSWWQGHMPLFGVPFGKRSRIVGVIFGKIPELWVLFWRFTNVYKLQ